MMESSDQEFMILWKIKTTNVLRYILYRTRKNFGGVKFWQIATIEANGEENFGGSNGRSSVVSVSL